MPDARNRIDGEPLSAQYGLDSAPDPSRWEDCERCGGDGYHEYDGHPLDDYIDANPMLLVDCEDCGGSGAYRVDGDGDD